VADVHHQVRIRAAASAPPVEKSLLPGLENDPGPTEKVRGECEQGDVGSQCRRDIRVHGVLVVEVVGEPFIVHAHHFHDEVRICVKYLNTDHVG
jgi:hypothetical protein